MHPDLVQVLPSVPYASVSPPRAGQLWLFSKHFHQMPLTRGLFPSWSTERARRAAPPSAARVATGLARGRDSGRRPWEPGRAASQVARYCFTSPAVDSETLAKKRHREEGGPGLHSPTAEPAPRTPGRTEEGAWARSRAPILTPCSPRPRTPICARPRSPRPGSRSSQRPIVRQYVSRTPPKTRSFLLASRSG